MEIVVSNWAWTRKSDLTEEQLKFLKSHLTIYPTEFRPDDREEPKKLELFTETDTSLGIARAYYLSRQKPEHQVNYRLNEGDPNVFKKYPIKFNGALRPVQQPVFNLVIDKINNGTLGGIISMGTGTGKSVLTLALISALKKPTLVLVHKEFLMNQWIDYAKTFVPSARVGKVQADVCDYKNKHIVIGMMQSMVSRNYGKEFYDNFGMVVTDEVHHCGSETWAPLATKFNAKIRLGLSATASRKDGADNAFLYHIGPIIARADATMLKPKIRRVWTDFHLVQTDKFNPSLLGEATILRFLCANASRNKIIVAQLMEALQADRKVLILSSRIKHLNILRTMYETTWKAKNLSFPVPSHGMYIGGMKEEEYDKSNGCRAIFATYQMVAEAYDNPPLDTLILATPMSDVTQSLGRILRSDSNKKAPVVVDIRDDQVGLFASKARQRDEIYDKIIGAKDI